MTRYVALIPCPVCKRAFERDVTREELPRIEGMQRACEREDCAPPKQQTRRAAGAPRTPKAPKIRETPLVYACLHLLALRGIVAWRQNQGALKIGARFDGQRHRKGRYVEFCGMPGVSDILGFLAPHGRILAVECKVRPNKPTDDQRAFLADVNAKGGLGLVVFDDVEDLVRQLAEAGI